MLPSGVREGPSTGWPQPERLALRRLPLRFVWEVKYLINYTTIKLLTKLRKILLHGARHRKDAGQNVAYPPTIGVSSPQQLARPRDIKRTAFLTYLLFSGPEPASLCHKRLGIVINRTTPRKWNNAAI